MSLSGSLTGITFGGISSGIDTSGIISRLTQIASRPITALQTNAQQITTQQGALGQLGIGVQAFNTALSALTSSTAFSSTVATSSDITVATVTGGSGFQAGTYSLSVSQLAQAQKIATTAQASVSTPVNQTGVFVVNGKAVSVVASDSLSAIAQKINGAGANVTASIIDGGTGSAYLTLTSSQTGKANGVQLSDSSGTVLNSLGLLTGTPAVRSPIPNGALSESFTSSTTSLGSLMQFGTAPTGSFSIGGGASVSVDFSTDTLQTIADKINAAGGGISATVVSTISGSKTSYQLSITGSGSTPTFTDPNNLLSNLGVTQTGYGNQLVAAKDAAYSLDGVSLTSASNTITSAIPGATLTLLKGTVTPNGGTATPSTSTISLQTDTAGITKKLQDFATAYNNIVDYVTQNTQFDPKTFQGGPLFGDFTTQQVESTLTSTLFNNVSGTTGQYQNIASLGFSIDSSNHLTLSTSTFNAAMAANPTAVQALFGAAGSATVGGVSYVSSTSATKVSSGGGYPVNITQIATKADFTAESGQTRANPTSEALTFNGKLFGNSAYVLNLDVNSTLDTTIAKINNDATLKGAITASNVAGSLVITSNTFGTAGQFTVYSNQSAASTNSGIGVGMLGKKTAGVDVAGTINGEAANGIGQFLTGNVGDANVEGLQIQFTGAATGSQGSVTFSKGIASQLADQITQMTDLKTGILTTANNAFQSQIDDINTQISTLQAQVAQQQQDLQVRFSQMEQAIASFQNQGRQLSAIVGTGGTSSTGH